MNSEFAQNRLINLTRQWRNRLLFSYLLKSISISLLLTTLIRVFVNVSILESVWLTGGLLLLTFVSWNIFGKLKTAKIDSITQHLNRTLPALEESSELFLKADSALSVLERMQRDRVLSVVKNGPLKKILPQKALKTAWIWFAVSLTIVLMVRPFVPGFLTKPIGSLNAGDLSQNETGYLYDFSAKTVRVQSVQINIKPPDYTGITKRTISAFNVQAEEGSRLTWSVQMNQKVKTMQLIFSGGDTLQLQPNNKLTYSTSRVVRESGYYFWVIEKADGGRQTSEYFKLDVIPDKAPTLVVVHPEQRTEMEPGHEQNVKLKVLAEDDYCIVQTKIIATVTHGSGESVKFREEKLDFDVNAKISENSYELKKELILSDFDMTAGDELYFHIEALDNRMPQANRSRSETYFVHLKDTSKIKLSISAGLAMNPLPEYFRSQRQIIIDTEKLIQDQKEVDESEFKRRSNAIGIDQKALRLRYGQFLGEESESGSWVDFAHEYDNPDFTTEFDTHEHEESTVDNNKSEKEKLLEPFIHEHDYAENATLFSQSIKTQLKAALSEMFNAELHLRTYNPDQALPFEYRALVLLKKVQQESRVYVQKTGFEPTPLKPLEKRLTGDISKVENRSTLKNVKEDKPFTHIRKALQVLQKLKTENYLVKSNDISVLEDAGNELVQKALEQPGPYLEALKNLRALIESIERGKEMCGDCLLSIETAFWNILPRQNPLPQQISSTQSELSIRYFKKLGNGQ